MMRSLYAGVSGLQNHQTRMDVIGNNISNVNTHGFKRGRVNFHDIISQTTSGAARPNEQRGGVNAKQVGLGVSIASIDTIHTQGALQTTNKVSDLAITDFPNGVSPSGKLIPTVISFNSYALEFAKFEYSITFPSSFILLTIFGHA